MTPRRSRGLVAMGALAVAAMLALPRVPAARADAGLDAVLDRLVADALRSNQEVAGAEARVAQRLAALDEARARYLPSLDLNARYSMARGGRTIDLPVGDLLNPVYSTLNDLLVAQGKPAAFGQIPNVKESLLRETEQQSSLTLTQPLFDLRIPAAKRVAESQHLAALGGLDALRARIIRDVKQAYYRWLGLREAVTILDATLALARSNLEANQSLFRNGKITEDLVFRAEADLLEVQQQSMDVSNGVVLAQAWVNLLRNEAPEAPLDAAVVVDGDIAVQRGEVAAACGSRTLDGPSLQAAALARRPELRQLDAVVAAASAGRAAAVAAEVPTLGMAVDAGTQGERYGVSDDNLYVLASLVLRFNLFRGGADAAAIREASARIDEVRAARALAEQRIRVEALDAAQGFALASASLDTAGKRAAAAQAGFRITARKRDLGQVNQTEFLDARRALTDAELNQNRTRFEALGALAEIEYAGGGSTRTAEGTHP